VVSPILRGMLGIETDAQNHTLRFAPHVPAEWKSFSVDNLRVGTAVVSVSYQKTPGTVTFEVRRTGDGDCTLELSPALSLRSGVTSVDLNGHALPFHVSGTATDQHVTVRLTATEGTSAIRIHLKNDFGLGFSSVLPPLGNSSQGLRVLSESWNPAHTQLSVVLSGLAGKGYDLSVWNPSQIASVHGGKLSDGSRDQTNLTVDFPSATAGSYIRQDLVINFAGAK
jgi:hypothetical protein